MLKVAIVGCGKIADAHASQIRRIDGAKIVGACDAESLMAQQFCERFEVESAFTSVDDLLKDSTPDVVHITTPPETHFGIAEQCLEKGCHVYVEKPVTLYLAETEELIRLAEKGGLKFTVGHDAQFSPVSMLMRDRIKEGYLGGKPVHMEAVYCYDLGDPVYAKALLGDKNHWVRRLPGMLLHNVVSHGVARIAEHIESDQPKVMAHGFVSPFLRGLGESEVIDELRVVINDGDERTAYFTFSSQMRPSLNQFCVFGKSNGLVLDETQQTLISRRGERYRSFGERFVPAINFSFQFLGNAVRNLRRFLGNTFHFEAGKKVLIERFYDSIRKNDEVPIPYREIALTARIMEEVFNQIYGRGRATPENAGGSQGDDPSDSRPEFAQRQVI